MNQINEIVSIEEATRRRNAFLQSVSADLLERENSIAQRVVQDNSSNKSRLRKVYVLADEIMLHANPYVACSRGCSDCCKMNITLSADEADRIGNIVGRKPAKLANSINHPIEKFQGKACPFLKENACSIYADRPLVCRTHVNFDVSPQRCAPGISLEGEMPMIEFSGLKNALGNIAALQRRMIFADIRDFF